MIPEKEWSKEEADELVRIVEQEGFGSWKTKAYQLGTGRSPDEVRAKAKAIRLEKDQASAAGLLPVGTLVEALYQHVKPREYSAWYRAKIKRVDERRGRYVIDWEDGDKNLRKQPAENVRPLPWGALPQVNKGPAARQMASTQQQQQSMGTRGDDCANASKGNAVVLVGVDRKNDAIKRAEAAQCAEASSLEEVHDDEGARVDEDAAATRASNGDSDENERPKYEKTFGK